MTRRPPEVLAPAGDPACLRAAIAAGADAVYLGLGDGFNARARAQNFSAAHLAQTVTEAHRAGVRVFVTLNTLVFESELTSVEGLVREVAAAGADAVIVQDPAVALLAAEVCPSLHVHASTQMTISSAEGLRFAERLGVRRVVAPRELSVREIALLAQGSPVELEVFIHGALCMSWSGQCLTSEAWGGRSANRGQCAQSCRLPYDLVVDGAVVPTGDLRYLLSPGDLSGVRAVEGLMQAGVASLKIEGRLKGPAYVSSAVSLVARWVDAVARGEAATDQARRRLAQDLAAASVRYSRGFTDGFLGGADHQNLVEGRFPKHRGSLLGTVVHVEGRRVRVARSERSTRPAQGTPDATLADIDDLGRPLIAVAGAWTEPSPGAGVVFDDGHPDRDEVGGLVTHVTPTPEGWTIEVSARAVEGRSITSGARVWMTGGAPDREPPPPAGRHPRRRFDVHLILRGRPGTPLTIEARTADSIVTVSSAHPLSAGHSSPLDRPLLVEKLGALGGTSFSLAGLDCSEVDPSAHIPVRELKALRREVVARLTEASTRPSRDVLSPGATERVRARVSVPARGDSAEPPALVPLVRTAEQLDAVLRLGFGFVELDWMELVGLGAAVERARAGGVAVGIATVRVQKPGEEGYDQRIARLLPDAILARHWGAVMAFADRSGALEVHGDFSLNVTNAITANLLLGLGLRTVTAAHDLDVVQLHELVRATDASRVAVTLHHHIATFHAEHCVYAAHLSSGRDYRTCGRPCEAHRVSLQDPGGHRHPVVVDVGCRNTVFNATAQSAAAQVPRLLSAGVRRFRAEFVWESGADVARVLTAYRGLLDGIATPREVARAVGAHERVGVTEGTMRVLSPRVGPTAARHRR